MTNTGQRRVQALIAAASRRRLAVLSFEQLALALALTCGGAIVMLLLGTQILDWRWLVLLAILGAATAVWRIRQRRLSQYRVAQTVDRRLHLHDTLSTAWFLLEDGRERSGYIAERQLEQAGLAADGVDLAAVFPFAAQRAWALTGALMAVAFGLFAARYLITSSLSLKQSLVPLPSGLLTEAVEKMEHPFGRRENPRSPLTVRPLLPDGQRSSSDAQRMGADKQERARALESGKPGESGGDRKVAAKGGNLPRNGTAGANNADPSQAQPSDNAAQRTLEPKNGKTPSPQPPSNAGQEAKNTPSNGLLNRMKDALSDLMAKMRPEENGSKQLPSSQPSQEAKPGQRASQNSSDSQMDQNAKSQEEGEEQSAQERTQGQATEKPQSAKSRTSSESAANKGADAQSGVGRQDGNKDAQAAEQLRAMGKLAEIIGKRSADVTGDITIETSSGQQQLKTQYTGQQGHHADLGGEVNRSDVPVDLRGYVREYMEQVRRQGDTQ